MLYLCIALSLLHIYLNSFFSHLSTNNCYTQIRSLLSPMCFVCFFCTLVERKFLQKQNPQKAFHFCLYWTAIHICPIPYYNFYLVYKFCLLLVLFFFFLLLVYIFSVLVWWAFKGLVLLIFFFPFFPFLLFCSIFFTYFTAILVCYSYIQRDLKRFVCFRQ